MRQLSQVRITKYPHGGPGMVDFVLEPPRGGGIGKILDAGDLVLIRDRIDDYIRENFPPSWGA